MYLILPGGLVTGEAMKPLVNEKGRGVSSVAHVGLEGDSLPLLDKSMPPLTPETDRNLLSGMNLEEPLGMEPFLNPFCFGLLWLFFGLTFASPFLQLLFRRRF